MKTIREWGIIAVIIVSPSPLFCLRLVRIGGDHCLQLLVMAVVWYIIVSLLAENWVVRALWARPAAFFLVVCAVVCAVRCRALCAGCFPPFYFPFSILRSIFNNHGPIFGYHSDSRLFWANLRALRDNVYLLWGLWPECIYPENKPMISEQLLRSITAFLPTLPCVHHVDLLVRDEIRKLPWCVSNWAQLEIATRQLALHADKFIDKYHVPTCNIAMSGHQLFDKKIDIVQCMNTLRDFMIQLYYWLCVFA